MSFSSSLRHLCRPTTISHLKHKIVQKKERLLKLSSTEPIIIPRKPSAITIQARRARSEVADKTSESKRSSARKTKQDKQMAPKKPHERSATAAPIPGRTTKVFRLGEEDASLSRMEASSFMQFDSVAKIVDGSFFEGGGQVVRNAMALAAISNQKLHIVDVRANRKPSGLAYQHCTGVELVTRICNGTVGGAEVGSTEVRLQPGKVEAGHYVADPGTAGATALLAQAALPCLLLAGGLREEDSKEIERREGAAEATGLVDYPDDKEGPNSSGQNTAEKRLQKYSSLLLRGGTDASKAPPIDYLKEVLFPMMSKLLGVEVEMQVKRRGFYPKGKGELSVTIKHTVPRGTCLPAFTLTERGDILRVHIQAFTAGALPQNVANEMVQTARAVLNAFFSSPDYPSSSPPEIYVDSVRETPESAFGNGAGIMLLAETSNGCRLAGSRVLERGHRGADAGREAAEELVGDLRAGGCVDRYLQDQLVIFMAAAEGKSRVHIGQPTLHTCTAVWVAETLTAARFRLSTADGQPAVQLLKEPTGGHNEFGDPGQESYLLECDGAALKL